GYFLFQIRFIAFRKTSGYKNLLYQAVFLALNEIQNGVHTFFLGIVDETASVNDHDFALFFMNDLFSVGFQLSHQNFRIINVFGAAQRYDVDSLSSRGFGAHNSIENWWGKFTVSNP